MKKNLANSNVNSWLNFKGEDDDPGAQRKKRDVQKAPR